MQPDGTRLLAVCSVVIGIVAAVAAPAAAVPVHTLGSTLNPDSLCVAPPEGIFFTNRATPAGETSYVAPVTGVITAWRHRSALDLVDPIRLIALRPIGALDGAGDKYGTVGRSEFETPAVNSLNIFSANVPVQAGDHIALFTHGATACVKLGGEAAGNICQLGKPDPAPSTDTNTADDIGNNCRANIEATLEPDGDADAVPDGRDNCPSTANSGQENTDGADDGGDACDADDDNDGVPDDQDNCRTVASSDRGDLDGDGAGDACDEDDDNDGLSDSSEDRLGTNPRSSDSDGDGFGDAADKCPTVSGVNDGCPARLDTTPAELRIRGVRRSIARARFLRGVTARLTPDEPVSIVAQLLATARDAHVAARFNLVLASRSLRHGAGTRTIRLKPDRSLLRRARRLTVRLRIVATDAGGNRTTLSRTIRVR